MAWLTGDQALTDYAAGKKNEAEAATAALQHTGNDGQASGIIGGVTRAASVLAATGASGGALGGAAAAFTLGTGNTYTELYDHHRGKGLTPEQARSKAFDTAAASGNFSAGLGLLFPGGANALNNPTTRTAARQGVGTLLKSFLKGTADEVPEELVNSAFGHITSELNKGRTKNEAIASFMESLPETLGAAGNLGGGVEVGKHLKDSRTAQPSSCRGHWPPPHNARRSGHVPSTRTVELHRGTTPSRAMHEITHGIEGQNSDIFKKCRSFLIKRSKGAKAVKLSKLKSSAGKNYGPDEWTVEDDWEKLGGDPYTGKYYLDEQGNILATEILTMGIERLHADPVEFQKSDPEFFLFVITTLQQP